MSAQWIVLQYDKAGKLKMFGPINAVDAFDSIRRLCTGASAYPEQPHGRYFAVPLATWQAGVFDYTKARGVEFVAVGRGTPPPGSAYEQVVRERERGTTVHVQVRPYDQDEKP